jgi:hypothetical protein
MYLQVWFKESFVKIKNEFGSYPFNKFMHIAEIVKGWYFTLYLWRCNSSFRMYW